MTTMIATCSVEKNNIDVSLSEFESHVYLVLFLCRRLSLRVVFLNE